MNVWVRYTIVGEVDSAAYNDEVKFRTRVLGEKHWSGQSNNGFSRTIRLHMDEELAILFALKFKCSIDREVESV